MSKRLFKSTFNVGSMTLLSRIFGLVRDVVIAFMFGAKDNTDAFFVAFKIPNYFRRLFAEGGFSQAFVPILSEYKSQRTEEEVQDLLDYVCGTLASVLFVITLIGVIATPVFIYIFASGFMAHEGKFDLTVSMLRITFPYLLLISLTAMAGGILNTYRQFTVPAFTPVLLNISLILCAIYLAPQLEQPVMALAIGVFIAGLVQLGFQIPFLMKLRRLPRPRFDWQHSGVRRVVKLMVPTLFAGSVAQLNIMIDMMIASWLVSGSISWLYYSDRLMEFPLGVFGIALATVILPNLSEKHAEGSKEQFSRLMDWALRWVFLIGLPAAVALIVLSRPMLSTIFQYGEFTNHDVDMGQRSLIAYAVGLMSLILIKILSNGFFARQDTRTPVKIAIIAMFTNLILNLILVVPLQHAGLALATSLAATLNAGLLYYFLRKRGIIKLEAGWLLFMSRLLVALVSMIALLLYLSPEISFWQESDVIERVIQLAIMIVAGASVYFFSLWLSGLRLKHLLIKKIQ